MHSAALLPSVCSNDWQRDEAGQSAAWLWAEQINRELWEVSPWKLLLPLIFSSDERPRDVTCCAGSIAL
jgi:hypothetical protein